MEGVCSGDPLNLGGKGGVAQQTLSVDCLHAPPEDFLLIFFLIFSDIYYLPEHSLWRDLGPEARVADVKQAAWN